MSAAIEVGSLVMMDRNARFPRVAHHLASVREGAVLYPYVMACGYASTTVVPASEGATRCGRCCHRLEGAR